ncbi:putative HTH-type transcriptional regulator YttP [Pseudodesulfovibrio hydrargyri]|uniref:Putative HTH-type transcriptional regulator YttP n=1 Tax=Pseudodesulfovibrio hydrargyri TaxID=2125990 RepID=A0A1J5MWD6_9BACT|nr:TetR/AcrR family transcriptional regulator [Pseudodesulfovibrio hydrargyri]OIQ50885.1 putative HTH-type transcriptional regulator YttP [Pseudodesulfovibrio hydrargyri]
MTKRESILKAAAKLFADYSYDMVGIRDIAREADVNSAMISYYFGGKSGLHREIFARFVQVVLAVARVHLERAADSLDLCNGTCRALLDVARKNREVFLVGLRSMNRDLEWLKDDQEWLREKSDEYFAGFLARTGRREKMPQTQRLIFDGVMGMLFSDYLLGGGDNINDDESLDKYAETITQILSYGLPSLVE